MSDLVVVPLSPATFPAFEALLAEAHSTCACRYWHFTGNKNAWLERCAFRPEENVAEQRAAVIARDGTAEGLLACRREAAAGDPALGWVKLARLDRVPKLRSLPVYRALDLGPEDVTLAIGCFLVSPAARRKGVARALVEGAVAHARAVGAHAIEGFPRRSSEPLYDEEVYQGPERLFVEAGFEVLHDVAPYPVYRKVL